MYMYVYVAQSVHAVVGNKIIPEKPPLVLLGGILNNSNNFS